MRLDVALVSEPLWTLFLTLNGLQIHEAELVGRNYLMSISNGVDKMAIVEISEDAAHEMLGRGEIADILKNMVLEQWRKNCCRLETSPGDSKSHPPGDSL